LQKQLVSPQSQSLFNLSLIGLIIRNVTFGVTWRTEKIAKLTVGYADVRGIDISVYLPGDDMRGVGFEFETEEMSRFHEEGHRSPLIEINAFFHGEKLLG